MTAVTEFVGRYRAAGWKTVSVHRPGAEGGTCSCGEAGCAKPGKHPDSRRWPAGAADPAAFEGRNVGVLLGPDSGNLADVDLDCTEALLSAPHLLPPKPAAFGRGTAVTHHLYTVADGAAAFAQLRDPVRAGANATIVELRWPDWDKEKERPKAVQTVFPPSLHHKGKEAPGSARGRPPPSPGPTWSPPSGASARRSWSPGTPSRRSGTTWCCCSPTSAPVRAGPTTTRW